MQSRITRFDVKRFTSTLTKHLDTLEASPIALALALTDARNSQDVDVLKELMSDKNLSLRHRLQLCKFVSNDNKKAKLYEHLGRLTSTQTQLEKEFEWSTEQIDEFKNSRSRERGAGSDCTTIKFRPGSILAIAYCREKKPLIFGASKSIGECLHIKSHGVLKEELKGMSSEHLAAQRLLISLKDPNRKPY